MTIKFNAVFHAINGQLSTKIILLINVKMPTIVQLLAF